jgi:hypothetical protein
MNAAALAEKVRSLAGPELLSAFNDPARPVSDVIDAAGLRG